MAGGHRGDGDDGAKSEEHRERERERDRQIDRQTQRERQHAGNNWL
jgi:hypothetical protein